VFERSWHQAGSLRVRGSNPGGSRQPFTPGCQKNPTRIFLAFKCTFNDLICKGTLKDKNVAPLGWNISHGTND